MILFQQEAPTMATTISSFLNASQPVPTDSGTVLVEDSEHPPMSLYSLLEILINCIGIPGNIATLIVLLSSAKLRRKPINCFLIHQSAVDLWVCIWVMIESVLNAKSPTPIPGVCHLISTKWTSSMGLVVSTYNLTFMIIERSIAIVYPFHYDNKKVMKRMPLIFLSCYLIAAVQTVAIPASTHIIYGICFKIYHVLYTVYFTDILAPQMLIVNLLIPVTIMLVCNVRMFVALNDSRRMLKKSVGITTNDKSNTILHKQRMAQMNLFQTCFIVTSLFIVCWTLNGVALFGLALDIAASVPLKRIGFILITGNSCLNPYVYAIQYKDFQMQAKRLLFGKDANQLDDGTAATTMSTVTK